MSSLLITGGTGSFGQALAAKAVLDANFDRICIYSRDEHKHDKMSKVFKDERMRYFIGDVRDKERLKLAMKGITHVVHAAALKIVPLAEYNPFEYVQTNIVGAQNVIEAAEYCGVDKVMALSTDKAVRPINLYGATKLCAEKMFLAANNMYGLHGPMYSIVRYGNVAGSNGSVITVFRKQIFEDKPLTITDDRMTRFWITLYDAASFVYTSMLTMQGGETFIPEMPSFKVIDLAMAMIPYSDYPIIFTGIRPGEKIHEAISEDLTSDNNTQWLNGYELEQLIRENTL